MEPLEREMIQRVVQRLSNIVQRVADAAHTPDPTGLDLTGIFLDLTNELMTLHEMSYEEEQGSYKVIPTPLAPADPNDPLVIATQKRFEEHQALRDAALLFEDEEEDEDVE